MNARSLRIALVIVNLLEAASAFAGAIGLVVGFMNIPTTVLSGTPFTDFTVPALLLGFVVGGSALVAAIIAAFGPRRLIALASAGAGCITVGWLAIEIAMIGLGSWAQIAYMAAGLLMVALATLLWWTERRPATTTLKRQAV